MRSVAEHGLLHPIILAADNELIAGERRLRAVQALGERTIEARYWPDLSEEERRKIELAENLDRKELTPAEASRNMDKLAEAVVEVDQGIFGQPLAKNSGPGRPRGAIDPTSDNSVAPRLGVAQSTLSYARQHVEALERYPQLEDRSREEALATAKLLDVMAEEERDRTRARVQGGERVVVRAVAVSTTPR